MGRPIGSKNKSLEDNQPMPEEKKTLVPDEEGKIRVDKDKLDNILAQIDEQKKQIARLEYAASKSGLGKFDDKNKVERGKIGKIRSWVAEDGKELVITSWKDLLKDVVEKDGNGRWHEDQMISIQTEDGVDREMRYDMFTRRHKYLPVDILSKTEYTSAEDREMYGVYKMKVKVSDTKSKLFGKEYEINDKFFN
jgi:hypothetical protein